MIVFPWLVGLFLLLVVALVIASTPRRIRSYRSRGAEPFVYPPAATVAIVAAALLAGFLGWLLLFGPPD